MGHTYCGVYVRAPLDVIPPGILQNLKVLNCFTGSQIKEEEVEIKQKMKVRSPPENKMKEDQVKIDPEMEEQFHLESTESVSPAQRCNKDPDPEEDKEHQSNSADDSNTRSVSSDRPSTAASLLGYRRRSRSTASSCEEVLPASSVGLASSHGRLSSCSTVIVMEEQLMLNPVKPEVSGRSYMEY